MEFKDIKIDEEILNKTRQEKINKLKDNEDILRILNKYELKIEDIKSLSMLERYISSINICKKCQCLEACRQDIKGYFLDLAFSDGLYEEKRACRYKRDYNAQKAYLANFVYNDIPERYKNISFNDFDMTIADNEQSTLLALLLNIISNEEKRGYYIFGDLGTGKTYTSIIFANELARKNKKVAFVKFNDFTSKMRSLVIEDRETFEDTITDLKRVPYLIIDDIGSESVTSFIRDDVLFNILDYRMENELVTIMTSNLNIESLKEVMKIDKRQNVDTLKANRLIERVETLMKEYRLGGKNKRIK